MGEIDDGKIYCLYFDENGYGPAPLRIDLHTFPSPDPAKTPALGLQFKASGLTVTKTIADSGLYFSRRLEVERLHRALGEWLEQNQ